MASVFALTRTAVQRASLHTRSMPLAMAKRPVMEQVEVDEPHVQEQLGKIQMDLVRKAEEMKLGHSDKHRNHRRKDWLVGGGCLGVAVGIYVYTIYSIQQEKFLDDFDMPDPLEEQDRSKQKIV